MWRSGATPWIAAIAALTRTKRRSVSNSAKPSGAVATTLSSTASAPGLSVTGAASQAPRAVEPGGTPDSIAPVLELRGPSLTLRYAGEEDVPALFGLASTR